ncbi:MULTISPECIES: arsenate reductase/protein-tyrosine-phosphatase family protein [unclassified Blastococcus]
MRILFVCTGNICRSPLAERLASLWAEQALGAAAAGIHIRSAGTEGLEGHAMDSRSANALVALGGDPSGFVARKLHPVMAEEADLVLTMTRRQRRSVLSQAPRAMRHTFTLPEAADLLRSADVDGIDLLPLRRRAGELAARLNDKRAWRKGVDADDVFDPIGQSKDVHKQVAARIARKLQPLTDVLFAEDRAGGTWAPPPVPARRPAFPPPVPVPTR